MDGRGFSDIDYNHLVRGSTGEIYEGRGWDVIGAHTRGHNSEGVGVCIIGNDECSDAAKLAVRWLYSQYNIRCDRTLGIKGHRDLETNGTACPGTKNYTWVSAGLPAPATQAEENTMEWIDTFPANDSWKSRFGTAPATYDQAIRQAAMQGFDAATAARANSAAIVALANVVSGLDDVDEVALGNVVATALQGSLAADITAALLAAGVDLTPAAIQEATETAVRNVLGGLDNVSTV